MINQIKTTPNPTLSLLRKCLPLLVFFAFSVSTFGQTALKYIPSNSDMVLTLNLPNLDKKVNLAQLQQYDFYQATIKELYKTPELDGDSSLQQYFDLMLADPTSLGYDSKEPFYMVLEKVGFDTYITFIQKMGNRATYESAVKKLKGDAYIPNLIEMGDQHIWQKGDELFAWNEEVVMNIMHVKGYDPNEFNYDYGIEETYDESYEDSEFVVAPDEIMEELPSMEETVPAWDEIAEETADGELVETDSAFFITTADDSISFDGMGDDFSWLEEENLGPDTAAYAWALKMLNKEFLQPITRNERFKLAKGRTDDLHFWMDYGMFAEGLTKMQQSGLGGGMAAANSYAQAMSALGGFMDVFYGDTYLSMGLNFENGRMAIRNQVFFNEDMRRFYTRALDAKFNKKFLRYVKGGDEMFGYFYLNYNVKNTIEETKALMYKMFAATPQYGQMASDAMKILGIFIDEEAIGNLLKGDMMVSVSGLQTVEVKTKTFDYDADFNFTERDTTMMQTMPVFTLLASYGNGNDIQKFIDLGIHSNVLVKERNFYNVVIPDMDGQKFYLAMHDGMLIFTNNQYLMQQNLEAGFAKKLRLPKNHKKRLCKNGSVVYWNIPNTIRAAAGSQADSNIGVTGWMNNLGKEFYSVEMTTSKKVENAVESEMFLNMTKQDTNALQQFFNFINDVYLEMMGGAKI